MVGCIRESRDVSSQQTSEEDPEWGPDFPFPPNEDRVRVAPDVTPGVHTEILYRAGHILPSHKQGTPDNAKEHGTEEGTDETLYSFFRGKLDERCATKGNTPDISKDVVTDDQRGRNPEPDETLENIVYDEVARDNDKHKTHVDPTEESELPSKVALLQRHDESNETDNV